MAKAIVSKTCQQCGKPFSRYNQGKFCSHPCYWQSMELTPAKFWAAVQKTETCWLWTGRKTEDGYGLIKCKTLRRSQLTTHRFAWILTHGPVPRGLHVLHRCDNPPCCNPAHLFLGTNLENHADKVAKGRQARGTMQGHSKLTDQNIRDLRAACAAGASYGSQARRFGISITMASRIARRIAWRHVD